MWHKQVYSYLATSHIRNVRIVRWYHLLKYRQCRVMFQTTKYKQMHGNAFMDMSSFFCYAVHNMATHGHVDMDMLTCTHMHMHIRSYICLHTLHMMNTCTNTCTCIYTLTHRLIIYFTSGGQACIACTKCLTMHKPSGT